MPARDGNFYGIGMESRPGTRGGVYRLTPDGRVRMMAFARYLPVDQVALRWGSNPSESLAVGDDGAIYGVMSSYGVFGNGTLFKMPPGGRIADLYHFESSTRLGNPGLAVMGTDCYALTDTEVIRFGKDGSVQKIALPTQGYFSLVATKARELLLFSIYYSGSAGAWKLNGEDIFEAIPGAPGMGRSLQALPDGSVLGVDGGRVFRLEPNKTWTSLHSFENPALGLTPVSVFTALDGGVFGFTGEGGSESYGVNFKISLGTNRYTLLDNLPSPGDGLSGYRWLEDLLPEKAAVVVSRNRPPAARDDLVRSGLLKVPADSAAGALPQVSINVLRNDSDADKDALTIIQVGAPAHGTAVLDPDTQRIVYTAASATVETDLFTYTVSDGHYGTAEGWVAIRTNAVGKYVGPAITVPNATAGDPGTNVGNLTLRVGRNRNYLCRAKLYGKTYTFTGNFNDSNHSAKLLHYFRAGGSTAVQLRLRPDGAKWTVEAGIQYFGYSSTASCALVP